MKLIKISLGLSILVVFTASTSYAAEVRICNKSEVVLNNIEVNYWKYRKLDVGECTDYYKDPLAQKNVTIGLNIDGKHLGYASKGTPILLEDGRYSYEISLPSGLLHLETIKD